MIKWWFLLHTSSIVPWAVKYYEFLPNPSAWKFLSIRLIPVVWSIAIIYKLDNIQILASLKEELPDYLFLLAKRKQKIYRKQQIRIIFYLVSTKSNQINEKQTKMQTKQSKTSSKYAVHLELSYI